MQRVIKYSLLVIGIIVGSIHLRMGLKTMFVFSNNEPISTWFFVLSGPLSTLPAVVVSFLWPRVGGTWLIFGSIFSLIAFMVGTMRDTQSIMWYFINYSAPMFMLGLAAFLQHKVSTKRDNSSFRDT